MTSKSRRGVAFLVMVMAWRSIAAAPVRAESAEPEWACTKGSGYCCDCVWSSTYRQCSAVAEPGYYYEKCGVADNTPCTGGCIIFE